jgi:sugar phosphate isomerase/epimerase
MEARDGIEGKALRRPEAPNPLGGKLAASSAFWGNPSGEQLGPWLEEIRGIGYDGVTCFVDFSVWTEELGDAGALRSALAGSGLDLASLITGVHTDFDRYRARCDALGEIGCGDLVCIGGTGKEPSDVVALGALLNHVGEIGARCGVRVSYHHHTDTSGETFADVERLLAATDPELVFLTLDIGHATKDFVDIPLQDRAARLLETHWDRVGIVEFKDWHPETDLDTPLGEGLGNLAEAARVLSARAYSGWVVVEQIHDLGRGWDERLACASRSLRFLTNLLRPGSADVEAGHR